MPLLASRTTSLFSWLNVFRRATDVVSNVSSRNRTPLARMSGICGTFKNGSRDTEESRDLELGCRTDRLRHRIVNEVCEVRCWQSSKEMLMLRDSEEVSVHTLSSWLCCSQIIVIFMILYNIRFPSITFEPVWLQFFVFRIMRKHRAFVAFVICQRRLSSVW